MSLVNEFYRSLCLEFVQIPTATIRSCVKDSGISKSSLHNFMRKKLRDLDFNLYRQVVAKLEKNKIEKCYRGGEATRKKWAALKAK